MACSNVLEAIAMGGLSGFAATGCNQLYKKYSRYNGTSAEVDTTVIDSSSSDGEGF